MSKAKFEAARELIAEKHLDEARALLNLIDHPLASVWLTILADDDTTFPFTIPADLPHSLDPIDRKLKQERLFYAVSGGFAWGIALEWLIYNVFFKPGDFEWSSLGVVLIGFVSGLFGIARAINEDRLHRNIAKIKPHEVKTTSVIIIIIGLAFLLVALSTQIDFFYVAAILTFLGALFNYWHHTGLK